MPKKRLISGIRLHATMPFRVGLRDDGAQGRVLTSSSSGAGRRDDHIRSWYHRGATKVLVVSATEFKARCLALLDQTEQHGETITITRRGRPVAVLGPAKRD